MKNNVLDACFKIQMTRRECQFMQDHLKKKYGLFTAICMVVGIVIGSGVFFKAEAVLKATGGNMPQAIIAWLVVGLVMIVCSYIFANLATKHEKVGGLLDYAEATVGKRYSYNIGWFMAAVYTPAITGVLAWVSARYVAVLLSWDITGNACMILAASFLCFSYTLNALSPILAGKFQVSTTIIKMIPLLSMGVIGIVLGLNNDQLIQNFTFVSTTDNGSLMAAIVAVAFAYEGWILATSINLELRDSKKNLPKALVIGSFIVVATYVLYYIGLNGVVTTGELMASGENAAKTAFQRMFGNVAGTGIFVLIVISCLGTLNGLMLSCCRGFYSLSANGHGPNPKLFVQVDPVTNMPNNSAILGLALSSFWLLYFFGANLTAPWFGPYFSFDSSELPIITLYGMYIPMFIQIMRKSTDLSSVKRYVMPSLGLCGCFLMIYAAFAAYHWKTVAYLLVYVVIMGIGNLFYRKEK